MVFFYTTWILRILQILIFQYFECIEGTFEDILVTKSPTCALLMFLHCGGCCPPNQGSPTSVAWTPMAWKSCHRCPVLPLFRTSMACSSLRMSMPYMSKIWHLWADHDAVLARCDAISTNHDANDDFDDHGDFFMFKSGMFNHSSLIPRSVRPSSLKWWSIKLATRAFSHAIQVYLWKCHLGLGIAVWMSKIGLLWVTGWPSTSLKPSTYICTTMIFPARLK